MIYKHNLNKTVTLVRDTDQLVFGTLCSVRKLAIKAYRLVDGEVQIKFRGKWWDVNETANNNVGFFKSLPQISLEDGVVYGINALVEISDWSQHIK